MSIKIFIKKSALNEINKSVGGAVLAALKKQVIAILKKHEDNDVKKAIEYFNIDELSYSHLEKSIDGQWIEKAGYGIGTVRIWKGKKYKKVSASPTRWVRVFDKMDRGAKSSMTRLIHKVQACKDVNELYQFCMSNHSIFQDANGVDLPIMDKLRAAIDEQNGKIERSEVNKPDTNNAEQEKYNKLLKEFKDEIASGKRNNTKELKEDIKEWKNFVAAEMSYRKEHNGENGGLSDAHIKHIQNCIKVGEEELQRRQDKKSGKKDSDKDYKEDKYNVTDGDRTKLLWNVRTAQDDIDSYEKKLAEIEHEGQKIASQKGDLSDSDAKKLIDLGKKRNMWQEKLKTRNADLMAAKQKLAEHDEKIKREKEAKEVNEKEETENFTKPALTRAYNAIMMQSSQNIDTIIGKIESALKDNPNSQELKTRLAVANKVKELGDDKAAYEKIENAIENNTFNSLKDESKESESEKHLNRSNAMMGNQNAKKWGLSDDDLEKMKTIKDKVEKKFKELYGDKKLSDYYETSNRKDILSDMIRRAKDPEIRKLSNTLWSMDGKMPDEYLADTTKRLEKVVDESAAKDAGNKANAAAWEIGGMNYYWRAHIDEHQAMALTEYEALADILESNNGEINQDGKKAVSDALNVLNEMKKNYASDYYRKYDYSMPNDTKQDDLINRYTELAEKYGNGIPKEEVKAEKKVDDTVQETEKELELPKQKNHRYVPSFEPVDSTTVDKQNIAKTTKVSDGKVTIPATKEIKNEIKSLLNNLSKNPQRPFMQHVFYDGENLIATDARVLKTIKIGAIDGIEPNKYVKIDASGKENISIEQDDGDYGNYPSYKRVIPGNNEQKITLNNNAIKDKIEEMKKDGSIDMETGRITLKIKDGNVMLDDVSVGSANNVEFDNGKDFINFNYKYLQNALLGESSIMAVSNNSDRAVSISTKVSDNVIMPLIGSDEVNYANNREAKTETDKYIAKQKAEKEAAATDRKKRSLTDEAKSDVLKNKPYGVTDNDYEHLIDYTNDFYLKNGYDNSSERAKQQIKATVDMAINNVNNRNFDMLESIEQQDNKVSRKVFETLTAIPLGTNAASAREAWKKWVGKDAWNKYKDEENAKVQAEKDRAAAEKKARSDADNEQYKGFLAGKTPAGAAKAKETLNKKGNFGGKIMSWQELADKYIADGGHANTYEYITSGGKKKPYYSIADKEGKGYEVPKTVYDYAMHISGGVKKSLADIIMLDEYEHDDFDDDFDNYDASQPELFNTTEYKVLSAMDSVLGCC